MNTFLGEINKIPDSDANAVLQLSVMCPKLVLTGSLSMHVLGLKKIREQHDIDMALIDYLTEDELLLIMSFYDFEVADNLEHSGMDYDLEDRQFYPLWKILDSDSKISISNILKGEIIQLRKVEKGRIVQKIDIFNRWLIKPKDYFVINYNEIDIKITVPAVSIAQKAMYAFSLCDDDKRLKHFYDIKYFIENYDEYFRTIHSIVIQGENEYIQKFNFIEDKFIKISLYTKIKNKILWLLRKKKS